MNLDQYANVIKAVTMLLLLFFVAYIYKDCKNKKVITAEKSTILPSKVYETQILKLDSITTRIPYAYSDSERTNFLRNYSKFR